MKKLIILISIIFILAPVPAFSKKIKQVHHKNKPPAKEITVENPEFEIINLDVTEAKETKENSFTNQSETAEFIKPEANNIGKFEIIKLNVSKDTELVDKQFLKDSWEFIKGERGDNSVNLLMFSYHTREDRDQMNESNKLASIDLDGYTVGTYNNSYHAQTYYAGITRKLYERKLFEDVNVDFKYKLMALHGYQRYEFNIAGITPLIVPMMGITKGLVGVDFLLSPGRTVTFATTFRYNLPKPKQKAVN